LLHKIIALAWLTDKTIRKRTSEPSAAEIKGINKTPVLNEQSRLVNSKEPLGGTAPSSSFFWLAQVITQLMAMGILGLHKLAEQIGTLLKRIHGRKSVKEK
jgi:hypothetical protein